MKLIDHNASFMSFHFFNTVHPILSRLNPYYIFLHNFFAMSSNKSYIAVYLLEMKL
jgi:hypothetical protein